MPIHAMASSAMTAIAYDDEKRWLQVEFSNRSLYRYFDVPEPLYLGLLRAPSPGTYFNTQIRGKYRHQRRQPNDHVGSLLS